MIGSSMGSGCSRSKKKVQIGYRGPFGNRRPGGRAGIRTAGVYPNRSRRRGLMKGDDVANQQQFAARFVYAEQTYHFGAEAGPQYLFTVTWNGEAGAPPGEKLNHDQLLAWMSATEGAGNKINMEKAP